MADEEAASKARLVYIASRSVRNGLDASSYVRAR